MFYAVLHSFWGWERDLTLFYSKFSCTFAFCVDLPQVKNLYATLKHPEARKTFRKLNFRFTKKKVRFFSWKEGENLYATLKHPEARKTFRKLNFRFTKKKVRFFSWKEGETFFGGIITSTIAKVEHTLAHNRPFLSTLSISNLQLRTQKMHWLATLF